MLGNPVPPKHLAPLFKYHPVRFFEVRRDPLWEDAVEALYQLQQEDEAMRLLTVAEFLAMQGGREVLHAHELQQYPAERVARAVGISEHMDSPGASLESAITHYHDNGKQIFDLSSISAMFVDSDASSVPLSSIRLPYNCFYVYWGAHLQIASPHAGRFIDGCYVTNDDFLDNEGELEITFTSSLPSDDRWDSRSLMANIVLDQEGVCSLFTFLAEEGETEDFKGIASSYKPSAYGEVASLWAPYLPRALSMVANCLCYLATDKAEVVKAYSSEAPARLVAQLGSHRPTEQRRAASKLEALGFRAVHLCGRQLAESIGLREGTTEVPPHWRRGHFRHQRHGKGRSKVKVLWIHPVVVNHHVGDLDDTGHMYRP